MKVIGHITRRRCIGKNLAFADVHVEESDILDQESVVQIVFQKVSIEWNRDFDSTFPSRASDLPYGAKVSVDLSNKPDEQSSEREKSYLVKQWELLTNPREDALTAAQTQGMDGISCSRYLKSRGDAFLRLNDNNNSRNTAMTQEEWTNKPDGPTNKQDEDKGSYFTNENSTTNENDFSHGDNRAKALRAKIFATWLIEKYGLESLKTGGGVLDIAGGKGKLSIELAVQGLIQSTIVDPLVRKHGSKLEPREARRIRKAEAPHPNLVAKPLNQSSFLEEYEALIQNASICVGLHPDQCTEDIIDIAIRYNKSMAIVPCCVFSGFFPLRTLPNGEAVRTYEQFLEYLREKDERLQMESLPFEGRNQVIYLASDNVRIGRNRIPELAVEGRH